jgi:hypothetical protein
LDGKKKRRYLIKSTGKYQIDRNNTKLGGASTKIIEARSIFLFFILFSKKDKSVILVCIHVFLVLPSRRGWRSRSPQGTFSMPGHLALPSALQLSPLLPR